MLQWCEFEASRPGQSQRPVWMAWYGPKSNECYRNGHGWGYMLGELQSLWEGSRMSAEEGDWQPCFQITHLKCKFKQKQTEFKDRRQVIELGMLWSDSYVSYLCETDSKNWTTGTLMAAVFSSVLCCPVCAASWVSSALGHSHNFATSSRSRFDCEQGSNEWMKTEKHHSYRH